VRLDVPGTENFLKKEGFPGEKEKYHTGIWGQPLKKGRKRGITVFKKKIVEGSASQSKRHLKRRKKKRGANLLSSTKGKEKRKLCCAEGGGGVLNSRGRERRFVFSQEGRRWQAPRS